MAGRASDCEKQETSVGVRLPRHFLSYIQMEEVTTKGYEMDSRHGCSMPNA